MNKQKIQDGIDITKCKILDHKAHIHENETELSRLEALLKECDKLKLLPFSIYMDVGIQSLFNIQGNAVHMFQHGVCYPTRELAEIAMHNSTTRNKIEAYSRVIDPEWRADWSNSSQQKCHVRRDHKNDTYKVERNQFLQYLGVAYMSEKAAKRICEALNNGEINV